MNDSVGKITEFLAILNYLFYETDSKNTLKYLEYVSRIKEELGIIIDRRKVVKYLDALEAISKSDDAKISGLLPFKVLESRKGKGKLCRDGFILSDNDIENIVSAIEAYPMLSTEETLELKEKIVNNFPSKSKRQSLLAKNDTIRTSKIEAIYSKKNFFVSSSYRQKFILTNDVEFGKTEFYPNDTSQCYFDKELRGYVYKHVVFHKKPYLLLMTSPERVAIAVPVQNIRFLDNSDDFENDPNNPYDFKFNFLPGLDFINIEKWSDKLLSNETGDLEVVNLKVLNSRYANRIIESIKTFFANQELSIRSLPNDLHDLALAGQGKQHKEAFYIENLITNWETFLDWYTSDINIIKNVDIITPTSFAYRVGSFAHDLYKRIRYERTNNFIEFLLNQ